MHTAGATQINVVVKEGGNKLLQIQDNGHGIQVCVCVCVCARVHEQSMGC